MNLNMKFRNEKEDILFENSDFIFERDIKYYNLDFEDELEKYNDKNVILNDFGNKKYDSDFLNEDGKKIIKKVGNDGYVTFKDKTIINYKNMNIKNILKLSHWIRNIWIEIYCVEEEVNTLVDLAYFNFYMNKIVFTVNLSTLIFWYNLKYDSVEIKNGKLKISLFDYFGFCDEVGLYYSEKSYLAFESRFNFSYKLVVEYVDLNNYISGRQIYKMVLVETFGFYLGQKINSNFKEEYTPFLIIWMCTKVDIVPEIDSIVINFDGEEVCFDDLIRIELFDKIGYVVSFVDEIESMDDVRNVIVDKKYYDGGINFRNYKRCNMFVNYHFAGNNNELFKYMLNVEQYYYKCLSVEDSGFKLK